MIKSACPRRLLSNNSWLRVRQVVEVFGFLKVFAVAAHQDFVAGNIQKGLPVHLDLRCQEIHHRMRDDRQGGLIFSGPLLHIPQKGQGLRHLRSIIRYASSHTRSTRSPRLLLICSQHQVSRLKYCVRLMLSAAFCRLWVSRQTKWESASSVLCPFQRKLSLPLAASYSSMARSRNTGLSGLASASFQSAVEIFHDGKIRRFELANVRVPEDTELMI